MPWALSSRWATPPPRIPTTTSRTPTVRPTTSRASLPAPLARWADPYYWNKPIPKQALGPMLDVLTSWDGLWYLRIVRNGYPTSVRPHVTYDVADARAAFFPA